MKKHTMKGELNSNRKEKSTNTHTHTEYGWQNSFSVEWSVHEHIDILSLIEINPLHSQSIYCSWKEWQQKQRRHTQKNTNNIELTASIYNIITDMVVLRFVRAVSWHKRWPWCGVSVSTCFSFVYHFAARYLFSIICSWKFAREATAGDHICTENTRWTALYMGRDDWTIHK